MKSLAKYRLVTAFSLAAALLVSADALWQSNSQERFFQKGLSNIDQDYHSKVWKGLIADGLVPYHKLTGDDFAVNDEISSPSKVMTMSFVRYGYHYRIVQENRNTAKAILTEFKVRSGFDTKNSWRRSSFRDPSVYLEHEQGHADINEIEARTLAASVAESKPEGIGATPDIAIRDLEDRLRVLYDKMATANREWQLAYDRDTNTGLDKVAQAKATAVLAARLSEAGVRDAWTGKTIHSQGLAKDVIF